MNPEIGRDTLIALCAVAWADGKLDPKEAAGIRDAARQIELTPQDLQMLEQALQRKVDLNEVETVRMNRLTRLFTYAAASWMANIAGHLGQAEQGVLTLLGDRLGLSAVARERASSVAASQAANPGGFDLVKLRARLSAGLSQIGDE